MSLIRRAAGAIAGRGAGVYGGGSDDPYSIPPNSSLGYASSGIIVNQTTALSFLAVTSCVRLISETLSNMDLQAVRVNTEGLSIVNPNPPPIIANPFGGENDLSGMTTKAGLAQMCVATLLRGNAYAVVTERDSVRGMPTRLRVLDPSMVDISIDDSGYKVFKVNQKPVNAADMLHVTGMALPGSPIGLSVLDYGRRSIGLATAAEEFGSRFFGRGANMTGIIETEHDMDPLKARLLKETFEARNAGLQNSHAIGVLTGGAKFQKISVTPEDAQFLATRQLQTLEIAMLFGVPPHMLGQVDRTTSWGKGIEEQTLGFVKYTLAAWAQRFEDAWSAMLPNRQRARFDFESLLRPDTAARYTSYQVARNSSILTPNEIRARENMQPVEGGDDLFAPLNSAHTTEPDWQPGKPEGAPDDGADTEPAPANDDPPTKGGK